MVRGECVSREGQWYTYTMNMLRIALWVLVLCGALWAFPFGAEAAPTVYFYDTFDEDHGELSTHTPDTGTSWTQLIDNGVDLWTQSYNNHANVQANTANAGSLYQANATYSSANYDVSSVVVFSSGSSSYPRTLAARIQDANNMYILRYTNSQVTFYKRVSGTWSQIGDTAATSISGNTSASPYHGDTVTFRVEGSTLSALVNGTVVASTTDATFSSAGSAGMGLGYVNISTDDGGTGVGMDNFTVQSIVTEPTISTLNPADNATGVAVDANLVITFDQAVDVETGNITIYKSSDDSTAEEIDVTSGQVTGTGTDTITINPSSDLGSETSYYVQIAATAFDNSGGDSFAGISDSTTWNFTTADAIAPSISSLSPADGATGVAVDANLVITFSEAVDVESGNIVIYKSSDDSAVATIDVTGGQVTGTGTDTITINPTSDLAANTSYYVQIAATAFDDAAGNSFAGISDSTTWNFATVDTAAPTISSLSPTHEATGVSAGTSLVATFSEAVDAETGNIYLRKVSYGVLVEAIAVTSSQVSGSGTSVITITPSIVLEPGVAYYVEMDASAFDDAAGNSFAGMSDSMTWSFTIDESSSAGAAWWPGSAPLLPSSPAASPSSNLTVETPSSTPVSSSDEWCFESTATLRLGSKGPDVALFQVALAVISILPADQINGVFDTATNQAVRQFQAESGLVTDGIVGPLTTTALRRAIGCEEALPRVEKVAGARSPLATLRFGDTGDAVRTLQEALSEALGRTIKADGQFGVATESAVRQWQARWGLSVDGIVGQATWVSLGFVVEQQS